MLNVVIDTNVLLVGISDISILHWFFKLLIERKLSLYISTEIPMEYAEIIEMHKGQETSNSILGLIENLENFKLITNYYKFNLLDDEDDNKFVDCAIASNADYMITHDSDFEKLKKIELPKVEVIDTNTLKKNLTI